MEISEQPRGSSRRDLLKGTMLGLAAVAVAGRPTSKAYAQEVCLNTNPEEFSYAPPPAQVAVNEGVVPLANDAGLYYWDTGGNGPTVIFAHPGTGSALVWPYQQPVFAAAGFRTIAYSRRGHYRSPVGTGADNGTYADDLHALVTALGIGKFHLVAIAAGGFVVSDYATSYPDRLHSMVVACSLFGMWDQEIAARLTAVRSQGFMEMPAEFKELGPSYRGAHPEGVAAWIELEHKAREGGRPIFQRSKTQVSWENLNAVPAKKLLMAGGADLYQPPSLMRMAARKLTGCEAVVLAEVGHAPQWERPDTFNQIVIDFIRRST